MALANCSRSQHSTLVILEDDSNGLGDITPFFFEFPEKLLSVHELFDRGERLDSKLVYTCRISSLFYMYGSVWITAHR